MRTERATQSARAGMKVLAFSSLFPNTEQPRHGIFVETRLRKLAASGEAELRVVAPVPWFPLPVGSAGRLATKVAGTTERDGLVVHHPRFLALPGLPSTAAATMALACLPLLRRMMRSGFDFDLIDAHFYYPDGVAAALLGRWLRKPVVITARGSDITYWPRHQPAGRLIRWASRAAARNAAVSRALATEMGRLAFSGDVVVLRNGVDLELFREEGRAEQRKSLGIDGPLVLSVGNLVELKGHHLAIEAVAGMPDAKLVIIGSGPEERRLRALAASLGAEARVQFVGVVAQEVLRRYYSAADVLVLASSREGWPNVLLEAMACGTPVVATRVWGIPEIVAVPEAGVLVGERNASALREGIQQTLAAAIDRARTRRYAEGFGWEATTLAQLRLFRDVVASSGVRIAAPIPCPAASGQRLAGED